MVRTDSHQLRQVAVDSPEAEAVKVIARQHKTLIWERTRHTLRLRHALREYFPAALEAFDDLDAVDTLELLGKAPDPASATKLNRASGSTRSPRHDTPPPSTNSAKPSTTPTPSTPAPASPCATASNPTGGDPATIFAPCRESCCATNAEGSLRVGEVS